MNALLIGILVGVVILCIISTVRYQTSIRHNKCPKCGHEGLRIRKEGDRVWLFCPECEWAEVFKNTEESQTENKSPL